MESTEKRFGTAVRSLRQAAGLTQEQLAQQMTAEGFPTKQNTVAKLEAGTRPTPVPEVLALARIFNLNPGDFVNSVAGIEPDEGALEAAKAELHEHQKRVGELFQSMEHLQDVLGELRSELMERQMRASLLEARVGPSGNLPPELVGSPQRGKELDDEVQRLLNRAGKYRGEHSEEA